jgi:hypothetical protein
MLVTCLKTAARPCIVTLQVIESAQQSGDNTAMHSLGTGKCFFMPELHFGLGISNLSLLLSFTLQQDCACRPSPNATLSMSTSANVQGTRPCYTTTDLLIAKTPISMPTSPAACRLCRIPSMTSLASIPVVTSILPLLLGILPPDLW